MLINKDIFFKFHFYIVFVKEVESRKIMEIRVNDLTLHLPINTFVLFLMELVNQF